MARDLNKQSAKPAHEEIAARAYAIFEERGRPEGRDLEHWLEAEAQLLGSRGSDTQNNSATRTFRASTRQPAGRHV